MDHPRARRRAHFLFLLIFGLLLTACGEATENINASAEGPILVTRQPLPGEDADLETGSVDAIAEATGLTGQTFLGWPAENWIDLAISLLIIVVGYVVGTWVINVLLVRILKRYFPGAGGQAAKKLGPPLRWLVVTLAAYIAIVRLTFVPAIVRRTLLDLLYIVALTLITIIAWHGLDMLIAWIQKRPNVQERENELGPALIMLQRVGRVLLIVFAITAILSNFGVNLTALAAALGVGGLAISLAARDTIADAIAGMIILFDRPFRVGDRIEIQDIDTWGDVVDIGLRTTRIRTRDNRMVIVPNGLIASNQIINYTYPDPRYRIEFDIGIDYDEDIEQVRKLIVETVSEVEGVLTELPVEALYVEMGDSAMIFRVRWWIGTYADTRRMFDSVNTALQHAFDEAHVILPLPQQQIFLTTGEPEESTDSE